MQQDSPGTSKEQLRGLNILCSALMTGVLLFLAISIVVVKLNGGGFQQDRSLDNYFLIAASLIAVVCLVAAITGYKNRIAKIIELSTNLNEKLENYRAALIFYFAACEGAALFSVISFFLTGNFWFVLIIAVMLLAMLYKRPTKERLTNDLQLDSQEQQEFD